MKVQYNLHLGQIIRDSIKETNTSERQISKDYNLGYTGFRDKLNKPHFGTIYDLIKMSLVLKMDFVSPIAKVLQDEGIPLDIIPDEAKYLAMEVEVKALRDDVQMYKDIVKKLSK